MQGFPKSLPFCPKLAWSAKRTAIRESELKEHSFVDLVKATALKILVWREMK